MIKKLVFLCLCLLSLNLKAQDLFEIGDTLPNFSYQGQFTRKYELKDLKGSYVLVHFWASWNEESRSMQMSFIDTYAHYRDRKFKKGRKFYIVSVSLDLEENIWEIALKKDNLPWKNQVFDGKGWKSPVVTSCKIYQIPGNYLLDPNGRIIAKNIQSAELESILKGL